MNTSKEKLNDLFKKLNELLAQKATIDEQITAIRNMLQGVTLGIEVEKEEMADAVEPTKKKESE